ncbi:ATP-binding protein [Streptomyces sp. V1I1]|uniref:ATP-binding protein n=1 Tax=Streptomyces sp. V1I1 TaxID=3042272 RepID=UPI00278252A8|nr:ATP-binding protein [Streptomyces sp. V1I1]MDQ0938831.1 hypothetical protein [Streptomyces sp. V1I1]
MIADLDYGLLPDASEDHFLGLEQAQLVGTDTLLTTRDNIEAVIEAKAMMCVYGPAESGKTMSVNSALRHLAPDITHRLELRAGPTPRDIRHGLFQALGLPGVPPARPIEFDTLLKEALAEEFRVLDRPLVRGPPRSRWRAPRALGARIMAASSPRGRAFPLHHSLSGIEVAEGERLECPPRPGLKRQSR